MAAGSTPKRGSRAATGSLDRRGRLCRSGSAPILLWHRTVSAIASEFHLEARYLITGWAPWALMAVGLVCLATAGISDWRTRDRRFYRPGSGALVGWGLSLYLLGFALATQVAQIADSLGRS